MNNTDLMNIPKEKFTFHNIDSKIFDAKFDTKPIGYLKDAWIRFKKNKGSVVAACIIMMLILFAIIVPFISRYDASYYDQKLIYLKPKSTVFAAFGWNGYTTTVDAGQARLDELEGNGALVRIVSQRDVQISKQLTVKAYTLEYDTYKSTGFINTTVPVEEYNDILQYQSETGREVLVPRIDKSKVLVKDSDYANSWFEHNSQGIAIRDSEGNLVPIFLEDSEGNYIYGELVAEMMNVRVNYMEYYRYQHGDFPSHLFGTDSSGKDIFVNLAIGLRFSLLLAVCVSVINLVIGTLWGSTSGYYGGTTDLIMERIVDILAGVPFMITAVLFNLHLKDHVGVVGALIFAYILTGWIGTAGRVRTQFYRFKGQEYVLAARTLGAKNARLIYRHILPNALGTLITGSVLVIPGVIFSESSLAYLGIIRLDQEGFNSIGTMLAGGRSSLTSSPHVIFFPSVVISLLMISFNIFGNGLRDAFNPALRGADE